MSDIEKTPQQNGLRLHLDLIRLLLKTRTEIAKDIGEVKKNIGKKHHR